MPNQYLDADADQDEASQKLDFLLEKVAQSVPNENAQKRQPKGDHPDDENWSYDGNL